MPELPEVETIARGVDARVRGDRIMQAWFASHSEPFKTPPAQQAKGLRVASFCRSIAPASTLFLNWGPRRIQYPVDSASPRVFRNHR